MNYEENRIWWQVGDIVIHDADAKRKNMLMRIVERKQNAVGGHIYICEYIDKEHHMKKGFTEKEFKEWNRWRNSGKVLHDPKRFNLK